MSQKPQQTGTSDVIKVRYEKLNALKEAGRDPFVITTSARDVLTETIKNNFEEYENKDVCVAGRLLSKRGKGKVSFMDLWDRSGKIQIFAKFDDLGEEEYGFLKKWDIGDIVEVKGFVFKTQMGEISVHAKEVKLLSKSLKPLPEKYHGLTNTDLRYRQRYVDLIMNPEVKDTFVKRSKIIGSIRRYLDNQGFMEVETPMLVANAGGASARPFLTHFNALDEDLKLRISLELYLKRLIVGGLEKVYEIGRVFRNEGVDTRHNPEFTLMELYQAYTDYNGMMNLTENLYRHVAQEVLGTTTITYNGIEMDLGKPFERLTMVDAVKKYADVDFNEISTLEEAQAIAKEKGIEFEPHHKKGDILNLFFEEFVEEHLIQPTFIMDHPIEISPLTKKKPSDPTKVERFELFINTWEMCNAYSELNDPIDQLERFQEQLRLSEKGDDEAMFIDMDFVRALEYGMPTCSGMGIGIDRLTMFMTGNSSIQDVLFFPQMRPEKKAVNDPAEKYTALGIPEEWVPVIQKMGYLTADSLKKLSPGKFFNDLCGFNKKNKLGLKAPSMEEVKKWCEQE